MGEDGEETNIRPETRATNNGDPDIRTDDTLHSIHLSRRRRSRRATDEEHEGEEEEEGGQCFLFFPTLQRTQLQIER